MGNRSSKSTTTVSASSGNGQARSKARTTDITDTVTGKQKTQTAVSRSPGRNRRVRGNGHKKQRGEADAPRQATIAVPSIAIATALLTAPEPGILAKVNQRRALIRDRIRAVATRSSNGVYLHGQAGIGKTYDVVDTLEDEGVSFYYHAGHLTPMGLFDMIVEQPDQFFVLDDSAELLTQKKAMQILLAAIGNQPGGKRLVRYRRQGVDTTVIFTGGFVLISNFELGLSPLAQALKSRLHYVKHELTDQEMIALMYEIASKGWPTHAPKMSQQDCNAVIGYVVEQSRSLGCRLDLRVVFDKAFPDYLQYTNGATESHWQDLVVATLVERVTDLEHPVRQPTTRNERIEAEQRIARQIVAEYSTREERLDAWTAQAPGKSERAFYRRCRALGLTV